MSLSESVIEQQDCEHEESDDTLFELCMDLLHEEVFPTINKDEFLILVPLHLQNAIVFAISYGAIHFAIQILKEHKHEVGLIRQGR